MAIQKLPSYRTFSAVDLRAFDNRQEDLGVHTYLEQLGFLPNAISLLENSVEQIHSHDGMIDNRSLPYLWCSERAMPGGYVWSRYQLYALVEAVHQAGTKFYMGTLCLPNRFPEYGSKAEWLYEHAEEFDIFITLCDGSSLKETNGAINPLRRLPDGTYYEDRFISDLIRYLKDYHMDGYFAGDGWCGLGVTLENGDYHPDMIAQFEEATGIQVKGTDVPSKADFIWKNPSNRTAWIRFYADRWASFYRKLSDALHAEHLDLISLDPWARGPVDALYDYGIDYQKLAMVGYDALCLQAREENWGRNGGDWLYVWEVGERISIPAIRACAPKLNLNWAVCTCNAPEHWNAAKDALNILERQSQALPSLTFVNEKGEYQRALEGMLFIFGTDLERKDWDFLKKRWDFSFCYPIQKTLGPAVVWSDAVHHAHLDKGERWELTAAGLYLIAAGTPIHSAVHTDNLAVADADAYLLVDPVGITDDEVNALIQKQENGAGMIMIGKTDNQKLLSLFGIKNVPLKKAETIEVDINLCKKYGIAAEGTYELNCNSDFADVRADGAEVLSSILADGEKYALLTVKAGKGGRCVYARRLHRWERDKRQGRYYRTLKEYGESLPDDFDKLVSDAVIFASKGIVRTDVGQIYLQQLEDEMVHIGFENMGTCFYNRITADFSSNLKLYGDYSMKRHTPAGYIHFNPAPGQLQVTVPPDSSVEVKVKLDREEKRS